jgi:hypothetical protein
MSGPLSCEFKPKNQSEYKPEGGYCAPDGTVKVSREESKPAAENMSAAPPAPQSVAVTSLVRKSSGSTAAIFVARSRADGSKFEAGKVTSRGTPGEQADVRASAVEVAVPISQTQQAKALVGHGKVTLGSENADGSRGVNVSAGVSVAQVEWSYSDGTDSMSLSTGPGFELGVSIGARDQDGDGIPETCWGVDAPISFATCTEDAAPPRAEGPATGSEGTGSKSRDDRKQGAGGASSW